MNKADIGFFEELEGVLANKRLPKGPGAKVKHPVDSKKEKGPKSPKAPREQKSKALLDLLTLAPVSNPCSGCPFESKPKAIQGSGDLDKAKLLVILEKVSEYDVINKSIALNPKIQKLLPIFKRKGFKIDDLYFTALTRCCGAENLDAINHCSNYLRNEIGKPNIKATLILGLRPFQLLIDKKKTTVFKSRGAIFKLLGKPCLVTYSGFDE